jgi:hypothetical protein
VLSLFTPNTAKSKICLTDAFEDLVFQALNDLIDNFAQEPNKYLQPHHQDVIDRIANEYVNSEF